MVSGKNDSHQAGSRLKSVKPAFVNSILTINAPAKIIFPFLDDYGQFPIFTTGFQINIKTMFGELNETEIEQLLQRQLVGRLGCSADGLTYVVPLSYAYDQTGIYVHSREGLKIEMMKKNSSVCFQVDDTKDLANWQSAICWGNFEEVTDEAELNHAIKLLRTRVLPAISSETMHLKNDDWPFGSGEREKVDGMIFRIRVTKKTGRFEKNAGGEYFAS